MLAPLLITASLVALAIVQHLNLRVYRRVKASAEPAADDASRERSQFSIPNSQFGTVSILIPARNELDNIERCLRSLLGGPHEVIVLDDQSTDGTGEILSQLKKQFVQLRVVDGAPIPAGWRGKNWACHQLAQHASGAYLLFTDADTVHDGSAGAALSHAIETRADLLSLMPHQETGSFAERLVLPLMDFFYLTFFPAFMLERTADPRFSAANGQFLLFRRDAYDHIGGHAAIRGSVIDDLTLARRIREAGLRLVVADGGDVVRCRMYRDRAGIVAGFSKNLYAAVGGTPISAVAIASMLLVLFVVPPIAAIATRSAMWLLPLVAGLALRLRTDVRARHRGLTTILHPLGIAAAATLLTRSMLLALTGNEAAWKGRTLAVRD